MREILFRGKWKSNGEWVEGSYLVLYGDEDLHIIVDVHGIYHRVIPLTLGQYTGLTDKNGKKIFEGDIIKTDNGKIDAISVVKYGEFEPKMFYDLLEDHVLVYRPKEKIVGLFATSTKGDDMFLSNNSKLIEVIGNIHDNPELLKGGD